VLEYSLWEQYKNNIHGISDMLNEDELCPEDQTLVDSYDKMQLDIATEIDTIIDSITT